jgi:hypothetical protein
MFYRAGITAAGWQPGFCPACSSRVVNDSEDRLDLSVERFIASPSFTQPGNQGRAKGFWRIHPDNLTTTIKEEPLSTGMIML